MAEKGKNKFSGIKTIFDGSILASETTSKHVPFFIYLAILGILYIGNRYSAESMLRNTKKLQDEIKELNSESISTVSDLMNYSKQSTVIQEINKRQMGLEESTIPPNIIKLKEDDFSNFEE